MRMRSYGMHFLPSLHFEQVEEERRNLKCGRKNIYFYFLNFGVPFPQGQLMTDAVYLLTALVYFKKDWDAAVKYERGFTFMLSYLLLKQNGPHFLPLPMCSLDHLVVARRCKARCYVA